MTFYSKPHGVIALMDCLTQLSRVPIYSAWEVSMVNESCCLFWWQLQRNLHNSLAPGTVINNSPTRFIKFARNFSFKKLKWEELPYQPEMEVCNGKENSLSKFIIF